MFLQWQLVMRHTSRASWLLLYKIGMFKEEDLRILDIKTFSKESQIFAATQCIIIRGPWNESMRSRSTLGAACTYHNAHNQRVDNIDPNDLSWYHVVLKSRDKKWPGGNTIQIKFQHYCLHAVKLIVIIDIAMYLYFHWMDFKFPLSFYIMHTIETTLYLGK